MTSPHRFAARLTARLRAAGCVFAEEEAELLIEAAEGEPLEELVGRREAGEPLEAILGWAEFDGQRVRVLPGVFVPRQRSLLLVELAAARAPRRLLDLGCGSGALAAAVRRRVPGLKVWATDVEPTAVACARLNLPGADVLEGDLFEPLPPGLLADVIVAHLPYVPTAEVELMPREAREHEPLTALDGGADGLDPQRRAIAQAPAWLAPRGALLVASSAGQAPTSLRLMEEAGLRAELVGDDEREATVVIGTNS